MPRPAGIPTQSQYRLHYSRDKQLPNLITIIDPDAIDTPINDQDIKPTGQVQQVRGDEDAE